MLPTFRESTVERLAVQMASPAFTDASLLLLGPGFAPKQAVPDTAQIARSTFTTLLVADPERARACLLPDQLQEGKLSVADDQALLQPFYKLLTGMYALERASLFEYYYEACQSPPAYRIVAEFIQQRRFSVVVMTYLDMFFSEILDRAGLRGGDAYRIIDPALDDEWPALSALADQKGPVLIVRLYGDPPADRTEDILRLVHSLPTEHRCVVAGYDLGSSAVEGCLMRQSGDLWWIGPQPADASAKEQLAQARPCYYIDCGTEKGFDRFFTTLSAAVNRQQAPSGARKELRHDVPDQFLKKESAKPSSIVINPTVIKKGQEQVGIRTTTPTSRDVAASVTPEFAQPTGLLSITASGDSLKMSVRNTVAPEEASSRARPPILPESVPPSRNLKQAGPEKDLYNSDQRITVQRQRILSAQDVLARMEQRLRSQGSGYPGLETDVEHQRREIASLERELLGVAETRIVNLMNAVVDEAAKARCEASTVAFLKAQTKTVQKEYKRRTRPNTGVIAAAIAGAAFMARSIRDLDQQTVRELESFLPGGALGRRS